MMRFYTNERGLRWDYSVAALILLFVIIATVTATRAAQTTRPFSYGAWLGAAPTTANIASFQQLTGRHLDVGHFYINWATGFASIQSSLKALDNNHSEAMITWEPWEYNTQQISNGQADSYIHTFAQGVRSYGKVIQIRPLHEMNGNWYPWAIGDSIVNSNASYIKAWRRIVTIFRQEDVTNARFVWGINAGNVGSGASFAGAYPGNSYVDYVAVDGYNWGTTQSWGSTWQTFDQIFSAPYRALTQMSDKPILIPEWASTEIGGNKAAWITDAFHQLASSKYSRIVGAYWFNTNKETDWRINSSPMSRSVYRVAI